MMGGFSKRSMAPAFARWSLYPLSLHPLSLHPLSLRLALVQLTMLFCAETLDAQHARQPPPPNIPYGAPAPFSYQPPPNAISQPPHLGYPPPATLEVPIERFRRSFYQGAEVLGGYYGDTGDQLGGLDLSFQEVRASFGFPLGSMENLVGIRPFFRAIHLNGPTTLDVPETLYETGITFLNQRTWSPRWSTTLIVSPTVRSDFSTDRDALRVFGLGLANWQCNEQLKLSIGAVFLDREDVGLLPVIGFVWTPVPDFKVDGMIPRPRIAKRLWKNGGQAEGWIYLGGAFGGNSWAVTRESETTDLLTLRDYRVLGGYEVIRAGNRGTFIEGGYSFGRTLEYTSDGIERDLDDAIFVQASWRF